MPFLDTAAHEEGRRAFPRLRGPGCSMSRAGRALGGGRGSGQASPSSQSSTVFCLSIHACPDSCAMSALPGQSGRSLLAQDLTPVKPFWPLLLLRFLLVLLTFLAALQNPSHWRSQESWFGP